jgi:putative ABC transport system permease protein
LLPRRFRERFGAEFADAVDGLAADARSRGGAVRQAAYIVRELLSLARLSLALRRPERRFATASDYTRGASMFDALMQDAGGAVRYARRRPTLAATMVVTIALAVASATTAFGVASAVLWRALPFDDPSRLFFVWEAVERDGQRTAARVTGARHAAWRDAADGIATLSMFGATGFTMDTPAGAASVRGVRVSANYFDTLGIRPALGRTFDASDEAPGRDQVVILSNAFWRERLGGRVDVTGQTLRLSGVTYTIIGVMPAATYPAWPVNPAAVTLDQDSCQLWVPIPRTPQLDQNGRSHVFGVLARLHPGANAPALVERLNATAAGGLDPHGASVEPFRPQFVAGVRPALIALAAAAIAVLLIACANLAALNASAFESRRPELAIRVAIGASSRRLARQITVEVLLLVGTATAAGLLLTRMALAGVPGMLPPSVPLLTRPAVDWQTAAFAALLAAVTLAIVGGWPVARLLASPASLRGAAPQGRGAVYRLLVVAQVAIAIALTFSAGLLGRSLLSVEREAPGFSMERVLVADVGLPRRGAPDARRNAETERRLLAAIAARPDVQAAAVAYDHPLEANWGENPTVLGDAGNESQQRQVDLRIVSPGYFEALGVELLDGRTLTERDAFDAPGAVVVNEAFARQLGGRAIGRRLTTSTPSAMFPGAPREFEIVGVAVNERFRGLEKPPQPAFYLSTRQFPQSGMTLLVRTVGDPSARAADIRSIVRATDPGITFDRVTTLETILREQLLPRRVTTDVISVFAIVALGLAALGMFGLVATLVSSRTREIGIRLAIGASPVSVGREVMRHALQTAAVGVVLGLLLALAAGRVLRSLLVNVSQRDPLVLGAVAIILLAAAALAALAPAFRASRIDPVTALRQS